MDRVAEATQFELEVADVMRDQGVDRAVAITIVGLRHGELFGEGDLLCIRPLTPERRRRLGLGRPPEEVLAELGELDDDQPKESSTAPSTRRAHRAIGS